MHKNWELSANYCYLRKENFISVLEHRLYCLLVMNWIPEPMFWEHGDLCLWYGCHLPKSYRDSKYLEKKTLAKGWSSLLLSTVNERRERVLLSGRDCYMDSTEVRCVKLKLSLLLHLKSLPVNFLILEHWQGTCLFYLILCFLCRPSCMWNDTKCR